MEQEKAEEQERLKRQGKAEEQARLKWRGKVVGITGAGQTEGIGFAIAKKFLEKGARVFLCDLNAEALEKAENALAPLGAVEIYRADVSKEEEVKALFATAAQKYGQIDVFVNNAGIYPQKLLCEMTAEQWDTVMNVNLKSVFLCAREAFSAMKEKGGVIINAASYASLISSAGSGAYAASKAAVYSLTKTLAAELAPFHIRVNGFIPGVIATGMTKEVIDDRRRELEQSIALQRLGRPEDVANAAVFLASDEASYLTGTFIEVSGGKLCVQNPHMPWKEIYGDTEKEVSGKWNN